jgi:hypothetical protein
MKQKKRERLEKVLRRLNEKSKKHWKKEAETWRNRALQAEWKLLEISSIPKDSQGWLKLRKQKAEEALAKVLDEKDAKDADKE